MSNLRTLSNSLLTCPGQFKRTAIIDYHTYYSQYIYVNSEVADTKYSKKKLSVQQSRVSWVFWHTRLILLKI